MKQLTKEQVVDVMRCAGNFQIDIFELYAFDIIEVTKFNDCLKIAVHYNPSVVSYTKLNSLFRKSFANYKRYIRKDDCYSVPLLNNVSVAHFELKFYA